MQPPAAPTRILVLRSSDAASYKSVAMTLDSALDGNYELEQANLADGGDHLLDGAPGQWTAAVAIGTDAAEFIGRELGVPTVFCQIYEYERLLARHEQLFGVEAEPPLELQLGSWRRIASDASSVGIIVGEGDGARVAEARQVAAGLGIELHAVMVGSDQEAVYQFKRMAQSIDGVWLLPNSEILSPRALQEILAYALHHRVHSIVFNKALFDLGALLSVTGNTGDVAATVSRVLDALLVGNTAELARMTPLTTVDAEVNREAAEQLGVALTIATAAPYEQVSASAGGT